jgi:chromosome partitioning protein
VKIIAVYSIKGGVGKTAAAVNLAHLCSESGRRTLLCDLDPQGASSFYFRTRPEKKLKAKKLLKEPDALLKGVKSSDYERLDILPAHISLRNIDIALGGMKRSEKRLREALRPLGANYDVIFLDCPPNLTLLSENVFNAADWLLSPLIPTTLSVISFEKLLAFFKKKELDASKIIYYFSMVEARKKLHSGTMDRMLSSASGDKAKLLTVKIPYSSDIEKMGEKREPVTTFAPSSKGASAFKGLWDELKCVVL